MTSSEYDVTVFVVNVRYIIACTVSVTPLHFIHKVPYLKY